jgi:hypothetical protein
VEPSDRFCPECGGAVGGRPANGPDKEYVNRFESNTNQKNVESENGPTTFERPLTAPPGSFISLNEQQGELFVMRAGEEIWHFLESEGAIEPGDARPLVIRDEQVVHLAHTDRYLDPQLLLARVRSILDSQSVPVEVRLVKARWLSDPREVRPRLVASLREHPYSDVKMIMGVDYMGTWASFHLCLGTQPEPIPPKPKWEMPYDAIAALVLGGVLLLISFAAGSGGLGFVALASAGYGVFRISKSYQEHEARWLAKRTARELEKVVERFSRTFKVDDMRLFSTAMREVFKLVVDDIVERGGRVVRIEGGSGGFFRSEAQHKSRSPEHLNDAAQAEV